MTGAGGDRSEMVRLQFEEAQRQPAAERADWIRTHTTGDPEREQELLRMLRQHLAEGGEDRGGSDDHGDAMPGACIGPYRLVRELGRGGMGVVWLAEQEQPIRRQVAVKVIKLGMDSRAMLARFEFERQTQAPLASDHIAKVFDAGLTAAGRPYFAMEYIDGLPLNAFCDRHGLSLRQRIALFRQVCDGVQHAHQRGVIHRDLKPGNILVAGDATRPTAKIIDFGIARAIGADDRPATLATLDGQMIGTPEYMSPEQTGIPGAIVDTRSDVYSLGVVLYELLAGGLPFSTVDLRRSGLANAQRMIREIDPPTPSTRAARTDDDSAQRRGLQRTTWIRSLRGDLDWITMKAIAKDPGRRYASPLDLARDLDLCLRDEPVSAGPPGALYRLSKFTRRHRLPLAAGVLLTLVAAIGTTVVGAQEARVAAERQQRIDVLQRQLTGTVAQLDLLTTDDRWQLGSISNATAAAQRLVAELAPLQPAATASGDVDLPLLRRRLEDIDRDVRLIDTVDRSLYLFRQGSDARAARLHLDGALPVLDAAGVDLSGSTPGWPESAGAVVASHPRSQMLLSLLLGVRRNAPACGEAALSDRARDVIGTCTSGLRRELYTGNWGGRPEELRQRLKELLPTIDDPVELAAVAMNADRLGLSAEVDAVAGRLSLHRPGSHSLLLLAVQREWSRAGPSPEATPDANAQAVRRLEPLVQAVQAGHPELRAGWIFRARLLTLAADHRAVDACREVLAHFPDDPFGLLFLGVALRIAHDSDGARAALDRANVVDPTAPEVLMQLADLAADPARRVDLLQRAVDADPTYTDAVLALAAAQIAAEQWRPALATLAPYIGANWRTAPYPEIEQIAEHLDAPLLRSAAALARRALASGDEPVAPIAADDWRAVVDSACSRLAADGDCDGAIETARALLTTAMARDDAAMQQETWRIVDAVLDRLDAVDDADLPQRLTSFLRTQVIGTLHPLRPLLLGASGRERQGQELDAPMRTALQTLKHLQRVRDRLRP